MKALLVVIVVLLVGIAALGFYRGWFRLSADSTDQKSSATFTVDQNKITDDEDKAKERVQDFGHKTKETTGGPTEKVRYGESRQRPTCLSRFLAIQSRVGGAVVT